MVLFFSKCVKRQINALHASFWKLVLKIWGKQFLEVVVVLFNQIKMYIVVFKLFNIIIFNIAKSALHLEKMKPTLTFTRDSKNTKKPLHMKNGVFLIYAPRKIEISPMQFSRNDTVVTVNLPENYRDYITSKFRHDKIEAVTDNQQRIWIGILNRSLTEAIVIQKNRPFGFFVLEPDSDINIKHETASATNKNCTQKISKKKNSNRRLFEQTWLRLCWQRHRQPTWQSCTRYH